MEFRDALKMFRSELGLAQTDIAAALHVNITTVARWELGKTVPNRSIGLMLLDYAKRTAATGQCVEMLGSTLKSAEKQRLAQYQSSLFTVEHATISKLVEEAAFPIYVCDYQTDELLYANRAMTELLDRSLDKLAGQRCYECIMHRDAPCEFCHKTQLAENSFSGYEAFRHFNGSYYRVLGKLAKWNGHPAQVRYVFELGGTVQITAKNELRLKYEGQLALRRQYAGDALAFAHYNLTHGTVSQVEYHSEAIARLATVGSYEDFIRVLEKNTYSPAERKKFECIRSRDSLIKLYFQGRTHIDIKHRISGLPGYYKDTLDLLQNPVTYDIEAFAVLRDITDEAVSDAVIGIVYNGGLESVVTIDAATGETHPYHGRYVEGVLAEQLRQGDNPAGPETYLRLHCADADPERVIRQTSLPYVKEQLKQKPVFAVAYSLRENGRVLQKQARYAYLDEEQTTLVCVMQNISEAYRQLTNKTAEEYGQT